MNKISEITRQDIIDIIRNGFYETADIFGETVTRDKIYMPYYGRLDEITFLSRLYDLESLPSYDTRYKDALGDISCHIRFGDYDDECWFFQDKRFKLMKNDGDEPLIRFICEMLHPAVRIEKSPWKSYLDKFNELLEPDGYELYAAQHISGRDIYKARSYTAAEAPLLPDNLFSERYKELIDYGHGESVDNISESVQYASKKHLCKIMYDFAEPQRVRRNRYDNWTDNTDALAEAINRLNEHLDFPAINLAPAEISPCSDADLLASHFTPFLFDVIELQYDELSSGEKVPFQEALNNSFRRDNLSFRLSDRGLIELQIDHEVLSPEIIQQLEKVSEPGLHDLLTEAVEKHMQPSIHSHRDAVEKIWDALERLKTYYPDLSKNKSAEKIINQMSSGNKEFSELFNTEFKALTDIGNNFRIRHHETNRVDIVDPRHYDYFFNRCLSLIALAIQYLQ